MVELLMLLGTVGSVVAVVRGSCTKPKQEVKRIENKKEEGRLSSSSSSLSVEGMREITQRVMERHLASYYAPKPPTIVNNYNFTTVHNHITVHNHNTFNYFDKCSFHESYNFSLNINKCVHCGK